MKSLKRLLVAVVVAGAALASSGCSYNRFVSQEEAIKTQWAQVENQLQRRNDLIPNLVETTKGFAQQERDVFQAIADSRAKLAGATTPDQKMAAANEQSSALSRLLVGAGMASETTAAATGDVGVVRRDPMAMKPFAGYNFGDYWAHWLSMAQRVKKLPAVFHVNWFRRDAKGRFLWPGYGENLRVLAWIIDRCLGKAAALDTRIGAVPTRDALDFSGLDIDEATIRELLAVDPAAWRQEADEIGKYLEGYGSRLPAALRDEVSRLKSRLS